MNSQKPILLILSSNKYMLEILDKWFQAHDFDVLIAMDSCQCLDKATAQKPDVILLDIDFNYSNSLAVLEQLKADERTKSIPIIVISVRDDLESKIKSLEMGANDYIVEPFDFRELTVRVNVQLRMSAAQKQLKFQNTKLSQKNMELQHISMTDHLTGLYNNRYLMIRLIEELSRANRYHEPISCLMIDIDHFKMVNDTHGHKAGDMILEQLAYYLKHSIRQSDIAVRYGGEEFIIICPNTNLDGAAVLAEKLRYGIEEHRFEINGNKTISITVSIGAASLNIESINQLEKLIDIFISCADKAMYNAKSAGRNCIRLARVDLPQKAD